MTSSILTVLGRGYGLNLTCATLYTTYDTHNTTPLHYSTNYDVIIETQSDDIINPNGPRKGIWAHYTLYYILHMLHTTILHHTINTNDDVIT